MTEETGGDGDDEITEVDGKIDERRLRVAELTDFLQMGNENPVDVVEERPKEKERTDQDKREEKFVFWHLASFWRLRSLANRKVKEKAFWAGLRDECYPNIKLF